MCVCDVWCVYVYIYIHMISYDALWCCKLMFVAMFAIVMPSNHSGFTAVARSRGRSVFVKRNILCEKNWTCSFKKDLACLTVPKEPDCYSIRPLLTHWRTMFPQFSKGLGHERVQFTLSQLQKTLPELILGSSSSAFSPSSSSSSSSSSLSLYVSFFLFLSFPSSFSFSCHTLNLKKMWKK